MLVALSVTAITTKTEVYNYNINGDVYLGNVLKMDDDCSLESELVAKNEFVRYNFGNRSYTKGNYITF